MFILVILLGAGEGFSNGVMRAFSGHAKSVISWWGRHCAGRGRIWFKLSWLNQLPDNVAGIQYLTPVDHLHFSVSHGGKHQQTKVVSADICYPKIAQLVLEKGRFLNYRDAIAARPVCVIGNDVKNNFFKDTDPIGKFVEVEGTCLQVVGVLDGDTSFNHGDRDAVIIPYQTSARLYAHYISGDHDHFRLLLKPRVDAKSVEQEIRAYLIAKLQLKCAEVDAIHTWNVDAVVKKYTNLFLNIRIFLWVIGVLIVLNGVLGVSNMMLVAVSDRTQELGIRKILGASARETLFMILSESIFISLTAGLVGMLAGVGMLHILNGLLDYIDPNQHSVMAHLVFKWSVGVVSLLLLVMAGAVAGIVPAKKAIAILPIKALSTE
mmetsp:Transcript_21821/g.50340  ORF Transcript_21821/g.50340 Transcript_21821/m.50340 type:complete len:378 (+) Transcript_21821:207-1340(+)